MPEAGLTSAEVTDLYRRYGYFLRRRSALILRDRQLAEDAMQEAFVRVMRSGAVLREMEQPLRWLHRVVDRCALDQLRRGKHLRKSEPIDEHTREPGAHPGVSMEIRDAVLAFLRELTEQEQEIALLAFLDGLTQGEIADEVGLSRVTINKKLQTIRERAERTIGQGAA